MCSTPYGIKGIGTSVQLLKFIQVHSCAQRLTASKELELLVVQAIQGAPAHVLNALRHQRNWNGNGRRRWSVPKLRAQRLTASKELEQDGMVFLCELHRVLNALRHQRNWNPGLPEPLRHPFLQVLNALRHQRNWNLGCGDVLGSRLWVLNALRHQRNWNSSRILHLATITSACSTPYGIKGIGTVRLH